MLDYHDIGFVRVASVSPPLQLADPLANAGIIVDIAGKAWESGHDLVLFPELSVTGYTCEDLFFLHAIQAHTRSALAGLAESSKRGGLLVVGAPWRVTDGRMFNCAFVLGQGRVLAAIPKCELPNHGEFYEKRWFVSGTDVDLDVIDADLGKFRLATRQLVRYGELCLGVELCEDLWAPHPPGIDHALAGANVIVNLSASDELIGKTSYRRDLVRMASARRLCGYVYAGAGALESTKDVVFGGHLLIAEQGRILAEGKRFSLTGEQISAELDIHAIGHERSRHATFAGARRPLNPYTRIECPAPPAMLELRRSLSRSPFVPSDESEVNARAEEIMAIQSCGLARRIQAVGCKRVILGLSGGLDSTLAALVACQALQQLDMAPDTLHAISMPGPGTTQHTRDSAAALAAQLGASLEEIDICDAVQAHLHDLQHPDGQFDHVFENAQARERTQILFDLANQRDAIVLGTGDLSELALGWCTYNGDHMASYNVNAGVPKTLVAYVVRWYAKHRASSGCAAVLERILATPISPELLPHDENGAMTQHTEDILGPFAVHDFYLYHMLRRGADPKRMLVLAALAFAGSYELEALANWLKCFLQRFARQQFKRTTLPAGPKVGSVSLSPRGDWRMPDEASLSCLIESVDSAVHEITSA